MCMKLSLAAQTYWAQLLNSLRPRGQLVSAVLCSLLAAALQKEDGHLSRASLTRLSACSLLTVIPAMPYQPGSMQLF